MARILGVDPGLNATGWGLLEIAVDGATSLRWGTIYLSKSILPERLNDLNRQIAQLVEEHRPDAVAIERPFIHKNVKTAVMLSQAQAAAMIAAASVGVPVREYPPRFVKQAVAGIGDADKTAVKQALAAQLGLDELRASADAADALAVAYCHHLMTALSPSSQLVERR